jgi:rhodanese-related sulfurtransferase
MEWTIAIGVILITGLLAAKRLSLASSATARQLIAEGAMVIDVRSPEEYRSGHLPVAVNIPLNRLAEELPRHVPDKNKALLLHCLSGTRSGIAKRQLRGMGYTNVHNLGSYGRAESVVKRARTASGGNKPK